MKLLKCRLNYLLRKTSSCIPSLLCVYSGHRAVHVYANRELLHLRCVNVEMYEITTIFSFDLKIKPHIAFEWEHKLRLGIADVNLNLISLVKPHL